MMQNSEAHDPQTDADAHLVMRLLQEHVAGIKVESVPRDESKTCDLRAHDEENQYFIEVKSLHPSEETKTPKSRFLIRERSLIDVVRARTAKANRQIRATAPQDNNGLGLQAWIRYSQSAPELHHMILGALYGAQMVLQTAADGRESRNVCLYFSHSDFFKYRKTLDGVIVLDSGKAEFHVNDYSDRVSRARNSGIAQAFREKNALRDAATVASKHGYLIADGDVDRNDEGAVCHYLKREYDLKRVIKWYSYGFDGEYVPCDAE